MTGRESLFRFRFPEGPNRACDSQQEIEMERKIIKKFHADELPYTLWQEREGMSARLVAAFSDDQDAFEYGVCKLDLEAGWYIRYFHGRKVFKSEEIDKHMATRGATS